jgi:hypothetical protein
MSHDDFDFEPIPGLPAMLPPGEKLLWQGSPRWKSLAVRAYHVRKVAIYFCVLMLWRVAVGIDAHHSVSSIAVSCLGLLALGSAAIGLLSLLAFLTARATVYSITTRRLLMRHGVAVPLTVNIPLRLIDSADERSFADGTGDIALQISREQRIGYLITWPHLRAGKITRPAPCFKALGDASVAASVLSAALMAESRSQAAAATTAPTAAAPSAVPSRQPAPAQLSPAHTVAA